MPCGDLHAPDAEHRCPVQQIMGGNLQILI
jgi:hypothetical protein